MRSHFIVSSPSKLINSSGGKLSSSSFTERAVLHTNTSTYIKSFRKRVCSDHCTYWTEFHKWIYDL